jgi:hypothetical protein
MLRDEWPESTKFLAGRTVPLGSPNPDWMRTVLGRLLARHSSLRTLDPRIGHPWHYTENRETSNTVSFWLQPARPLDARWSSGEGAVPAGCRGRFLKGQLDGPLLDRYVALVASLPRPYARLSVFGYTDKPRRNTPHVHVDLERSWDGAWSVEVGIDPNHPNRLDDASSPMLTDLVREAIGCNEPRGSLDSPTSTWFFERTGLGGPGAAYQVFRDVIREAVPFPGEWTFTLSFERKDWPGSIDVLNGFQGAWSFTPSLLYNTQVDVFRRPDRIDPSRPVRYPVLAFSPGSPPRLQVDVVHAAEGTWLECQTVRGKAYLEELGMLVSRLEIWEGPPEERWAGGR